MFAAQLSQELEKNGHTVFLIALFPGVSVLPFSGTILPLNRPIAKRWTDFEGWKQEQGLYYPNQWDKAYTPILVSNDKGEDPKKGALLVAKYGKGNYIYTGLSFFRELPAAVPGAFRLFANMISIGTPN